MEGALFFFLPCKIGTCIQNTNRNRIDYNHERFQYRESICYKVATALSQVTKVWEQCSSVKYAINLYIFLFFSQSDGILGKNPIKFWTWSNMFQWCTIKRGYKLSSTPGESSSGRAIPPDSLLNYEKLSLQNKGILLILLLWTRTNFSSLALFVHFYGEKLD